MKTFLTARLRQFLIPPVALALTMALNLPRALITASLIAMFLSLLIRNPWWWHLFHLALFPLVAYCLTLGWSPLIYLAALLLTLLIFSGVLTSRVPLYFSGQRQISALANLIQADDHLFIDLGAGIGSAIAPLAQQFPGVRFVAYEIAPLTYLIGRLRTAHLPNVHWKLQAFEQADLSQANLVYAFLSPEPMPALWQKIEREIQPTARFISNSFPVPEIPPKEILLQDSIHPLYLYAPENAKKPL